MTEHALQLKEDGVRHSLRNYKNFHAVYAQARTMRFRSFQRLITVLNITNIYLYASIYPYISICFCVYKYVGMSAYIHVYTYHPQNLSVTFEFLGIFSLIGLAVFTYKGRHDHNDKVALNWSYAMACLSWAATSLALSILFLEARQTRQKLAEKNLLAVEADEEKTEAGEVK